MKKFSCSPLLILLLFSYMLIEGTFLPLWVLLFSLCHEAGHLLAIRCLGGKTQRLRGEGQGFGLWVQGLSYRAEILAAAAGPLVSGGLAGIFFAAAQVFQGTFFAYGAFANGALAVMNLLPVLPLDGGRIFRGLLALYCTPEQQHFWVPVVSGCCLVPLLAVGVWQFLSSGYNGSLLLICIYLIVLIKENANDV